MLLTFITGFTIRGPLANAVKIFSYNENTVTSSGFQIKIETSYQNTLSKISYNVILLDTVIATNNGRTYGITANKYFSGNTTNSIGQ